MQTRCVGVATEFISPQRVKELVPIINIHGPLSGFGRTVAATRGHRASRRPGDMRVPVLIWAWTSSTMRSYSAP